MPRYNLTVRTKVNSKVNEKLITFYADEDSDAQAIHTALLAMLPSWAQLVLTKVVVEPAKGAIPSSNQHDCKPMYCALSDEDGNLWRFTIPAVAKGATGTQRESFHEAFVDKEIKFLLKGETAPGDLHTITSYLGAGFGPIRDEFAADTAATYNTAS